MTPLIDGPPNFIVHQLTETPTLPLEIEGLRRQHSHFQQSPQNNSIPGSPQLETVELPGDRVGPQASGPIKQLSELDLELSKLIPKGGQQQQGIAQQATSQQQGQVKLYSEVVRQQSIQVTTNEPQNVCITSAGETVTSTKGIEEVQGGSTLAPPAAVRKVSRFQVSTVVEQQQLQQLQQQQNLMEEKTTLITPNIQTNTVAVQQIQESNLAYQQQQQQQQTIKGKAIIVIRSKSILSTVYLQIRPL